MTASGFDREVQCEVHGTTTPAFACVHLIEALRARDVSSVGFHEGEPDPDSEGSDEPCGWCDACEHVRESCDGWNEESEALVDIRLLCLNCFDSLRILSRTLPQ